VNGSVTDGEGENVGFMRGLNGDIVTARQNVWDGLVATVAQASETVLKEYSTFVVCVPGGCSAAVAYSI
jgi:hypothetical protein